MTLTMKQARVGADMSQKDVANKLGVHQQTYMKYEAHPEELSIKLAKRFAQVVGVRASDIFVLDDSTECRTGGEK